MKNFILNKLQFRPTSYKIQSHIYNTNHQTPSSESNIPQPNQDIPACYGDTRFISL